MSMNGIDISNWQNGINLSKVPCDFAIVKVTEGTNYISPDWKRQYKQAKASGKCLGIYHYANGGNVKTEADFFLKQVKDCIGEAILVLDWEGENNPSFGKNDASWVKQWLDYVHKKTKVKPLLYISQSVMYKFKNIGDYAFWIAQYANMNATGYQSKPWNEGTYTCAIRQYSSCGRLNGYGGNLDLNKFYGDKTAWSKYAGADGASRPSAPTSNTNPSAKPSGSTLDLAYYVIENHINGDARKRKLGSRYGEVQKFINHIAAASSSDLASEVKSGKYGNNPIRKTVLMDRYEEVQAIVNGGSSVTSSPSAVYYTVNPKDTLSGIAAKYGTSYQKIAQLNGIADPDRIYAGQKIRVK